MTEEWKPITGYEGMYEVSNFGRVRSLARLSWGTSRKLPTMILTPGKTLQGYNMVSLHKDGHRTTRFVHRLVGFAFIPEVEGKDCINHIDYDPNNNHVSNLEWCTRRENSAHSYDRVVASVVKAIRERSARRTHCKHGHELSGDNLITKPNSNRKGCRECLRLNALKYKARKQAKLKPGGE